MTYSAVIDVVVVFEFDVLVRELVVDTIDDVLLLPDVDVTLVVVVVVVVKHRSHVNLTVN